MPNMTANYIEVQGEPLEIQKFLNRVRAQDGVFDFNGIILMPPGLNDEGRYDWRCRHWGTKWNAICFEIRRESDIEDGHATVEFETAWTPPIPIFRRISELFPTLQFEFRWRDEDDEEFPHEFKP